ncbi:probable serine/threonine-protein kinase DDB_G0282963 isoform X2 [Calliphora vicina]|uniref:probable serine/threonine-protein kinase DDB_G0282963 isoform X2 n=1 Tax=Calliphora vicina TaxID=7373 RepID=UPI00325C18CD
MLDDDNNDLLAAASEIQRNRLYFVAFKKNFKPKNTATSHYFSIDDDFIYENFYNDFGPLNICMLYRYCQKLNAKLSNKTLANKKIVHYTSMNPAKRVNAAYLIGAFSIIYLNKSPEEAYRPLVMGEIPAYTRFCDASYGPSGYKISLIDCLNAVSKSLKAGFFNFDDFHAEEYEYFERVENGDFNWIVPQKFIAFCGPHQKSKTLPNGYPCHSPETYFEYFRDNNVTTIIRLNAKVYHASSFENAGFDHKDLFFIDGSTPSDLILKKFLTICETTKGAIAVHCKAGLGRTGSLIGAYIMKHYNFSALEAIAWLRLCRPGSVIGHQQQWMEDKQSWLWSEGERVRKRAGTCCPVHKYGIYSLLYKSGSAGQLHSNENNTEMLMTRVKGISQKVDTMHLNEEDRTDSNQLDSLESYENGNKTITPRTRLLMAAKDGAITPPTSASDNDNDNDVTETEEDSTTSNTNSTFIVSRRRKSPTTVASTKTSSVTTTTTTLRSSPAPTGGGGGGGLGVNVTPAVTEITLRRTPPLLGNGHALISTTTSSTTVTTNSHVAAPLYSEKKLKKPSTTYEPAALQRPTIASTVKMTQAAIEKTKAQTQGDKLNQIKAMRRQHNSRSGGSTGETDNPLRHTRARSQPFRNNNNLVNMLATTTTTTTGLKGQDCLDSNAAVTATNNLLNNINNNNNNNNCNSNINNNNNNNNSVGSTTTSTTATTNLTSATTTIGLNNVNSTITTRARSLAIYSKRMGLMHLRKAEQQQISNNVTAANNNNNNANTVSSTTTPSLLPHHHHHATSPTLSSLSKQTKTYNNTLISSTTNESKIPIVRATAALIDLNVAINHGGGVVGSSATIPPSRSSNRLSAAAAMNVTSHHHMTLRGRSRLRYHRHQDGGGGAGGGQQAPPCTMTTARYYRDVSALPSAIQLGGGASGAGGGGGITTRSSSATLDLNSNPLPSGTLLGNMNKSNNNNNNNSNNSNNNSNSSSSTTTTTTCSNNTHSSSNKLEERILRTNTKSSCTSANHSNSSSDAETLKSTHSNNTNRLSRTSQRSLPSTTTGIPCSSQYGGVGGGGFSNIKRNKRSLSSTRIEKDKCDEYNTKLLRKTNNQISSSTASNNNNSSSTTNAGGNTLTSATGGGGGSFRTRHRQTAASNLESSTASSTSSASTSGIPTPTSQGLYMPRSAKYAAAVMAAEQRDHQQQQHQHQQQQRLSLKLRKKISY